MVVSTVITNYTAHPVNGEINIECSEVKELTATQLLIKIAISQTYGMLLVRVTIVIPETDEKIVFSQPSCGLRISAFIYMRELLQPSN